MVHQECTGEAAEFRQVVPCLATFHSGKEETSSDKKGNAPSASIVQALSTIARLEQTT